MYKYEFEHGSETPIEFEQDTTEIGNEALALTFFFQSVVLEPKLPLGGPLVPMHPEHTCGAERLAVLEIEPHRFGAKELEPGVCYCKNGLVPNFLSNVLQAHTVRHSTVPLWLPAVSIAFSHHLTLAESNVCLEGGLVFGWQWHLSWRAEAADSTQDPPHTFWPNIPHHHCEHHFDCSLYQLVPGEFLVSLAAALTWKNGFQKRPPKALHPGSLQSCHKHHATHGRPQTSLVIYIESNLKSIDNTIIRMNQSKNSSNTVQYIHIYLYTFGQVRWHWVFALGFLCWFPPSFSSQVWQFPLGGWKSCPERYASQFLNVMLFQTQPRLWAYDHCDSAVSPVSRTVDLACGKRKIRNKKHDQNNFPAYSIMCMWLPQHHQWCAAEAQFLSLMMQKWQ